MAHNQTKLLDGQSGSANSGSVDTSGASAIYVDAFCAVVGTPTVGATITPQWSNDAGATWIPGPSYSFGTVAGTIGQQFAVPASAGLYRLAFAAQTGGTSSTCTAWLTWY